MENTVSEAALGSLRSVEERLDALTKALQLPSTATAPQGTDPGTGLLAEADAHLAAARRLAALLDDRRTTWDRIDQATAAVLLRDLAEACHALRKVALLAANRLAEADEAVGQNHDKIEKLQSQLTTGSS